MSTSVILNAASAAQVSVAEVTTQGAVATAKVTEPSQMAAAASMLGGLILVLLLIFALAYLLRRFNLVPTNHSVLKTLAVTSLGQKERLVLVQVGEQQYLLGVSGQQVNLIDKLAEPIEIESVSFADKLRQAKLKQ
ncbi:flagellar biosynthetic protein FliO [Shewanella xiamenensis]|uniref:flagellar biosynthetic protein FliO n=1 Tax=Shewanella xiamenensis TaxID=332186 RepID=UPI00214FF530|nr:flagellar biosynthetic protein FliO [Shewanella xiamenensis]MCR4535094.1 flagellar biosynthetic protein FliO [Shewanella xiamenensis]WHF56897.1 flagellar biosynthetic protein FliO [Shewanella xiamenensis]